MNIVKKIVWRLMLVDICIYICIEGNKLILVMFGLGWSGLILIDLYVIWGKKIFGY